MHPAVVGGGEGDADKRPGREEFPAGGRHAQLPVTSSCEVRAERYRVPAWGKDTHFLGECSWWVLFSKFCTEDANHSPTWFGWRA